MAYFETSDARYGPVRKLEPTDWNHADVFNATLMQMVKNTAAIHAATRHIRGISIMPSDWEKKQYRIENSEITENSLADIYFSDGSKTAVADAEIDGKTVQGAIVLTCETVPESVIKIDCLEIRNEVKSDAG